MIPKIIHYCWFGNKEMPANQREFIKNWKKLMPDYSFKCWSEKNMDIKSVPFIEQAYNANKLAFVADYTRVYALYQEGGIYLDTDVKVLKRFDTFLDAGFFTSYEYHPIAEDGRQLKSVLTEDGRRADKARLKVPGCGLLSAVMGSVKGHPFMDELLAFYDHSTFDYVYNNKLTIPTTLALHAEKYGFRYIDEYQELTEGIKIYPSFIFCNFDSISPKSVAVHFCAGSWVEKSRFQRATEYLKKYNNLRIFVRKLKSYFKRL